ncbi:MAG: glutamate--tRNA ligase [Rhodospirillaceae bacterium]|nr:glutamate--tRNA ligase [Rhodospirillaceae bacterium]
MTPAANLRVRFAPSPTGRLHVGNLYVALANWLQARRHGGAFVLRLDDTDVQRSRPEFEHSIREDLRWLGLDWAEEARQSARVPLYSAAAERLKASGRLYPCYETPEELALRRKAQLQAGKPPIYDRAALALDESDRQRLEAEGRRPHWRFRLDREPVEWTDLVRGPERIDAASQSDPVLVRDDGSFLYTLPSVVDDIDLDITQVIRGHDHVTNTAAQIQIFLALSGKTPSFGHLPLLADATGALLSKRLNSLSTAHLRDDGIEPLALAAYLAGIGSAGGEKDALATSLDALAAQFDIGHFGRGAPRYDPAALAAINARVLHGYDYDRVADRLAPLGCDEPLWLAIRGNVARLSDAADWVAVCYGEIEPLRDEPEFLAEAAALLAPEPWDRDTWSRWTNALKEKTGRKGRALFRPLRLALTGRDAGPEMAALLPLIGAERSRRRLDPAG